MRNKLFNKLFLTTAIALVVSVLLILVLLSVSVNSTASVNCRTGLPLGPFPQVRVLYYRIQNVYCIFLANVVNYIHLCGTAAQITDAYLFSNGGNK